MAQQPGVQAAFEAARLEDSLAASARLRAATAEALAALQALLGPDHHPRTRIRAAQVLLAAAARAAEAEQRRLRQPSGAPASPPSAPLAEPETPPAPSSAELACSVPKSQEHSVHETAEPAENRTKPDMSARARRGTRRGSRARA